MKNVCCKCYSEEIIFFGERNVPSLKGKNLSDDARMMLQLYIFSENVVTTSNIYRRVVHVSSNAVALLAQFNFLKTFFFIR